MKELGRIEKTTVSAARSKSNSMKTTVPQEVVSLLKLNYGDKIIWAKILDDEGLFGEKGDILAVVRKA
jgi:hypothetical protein